MAGIENVVENIPLFINGAIGASETATSQVVELQGKKVEGYGSVGYVLTGTGALTIEIQVSYDRNTWIDLEEELIIGATGSGYVPLGLPVCPFVRCKVTESTGLGSIVGTLYMGLQ